MPDAAIPKPGLTCLASQIKSILTPAQQVRLLTLRGCTLCHAVLQRLKSSTARPGYADDLVLAEYRLAILGAKGVHEITALGKVIAGDLARDLAKQFDIEIWPKRRGGYQRQHYNSQSTW